MLVESVHSTGLMALW